MITSWLGDSFWNLRYPGDNDKTLHQLTTCSQYRCSCSIIHLWLNDCQSPEFGWAVFLDYFIYIVSCGRPSQLRRFIKHILLRTKPRIRLVSATGPGNPPAVRVWTLKTGRVGSRTVQTPDLQTRGGRNPYPYPSTRRIRRVGLHPWVPICGCAFHFSHLWSHSDMLLLIVKFSHWFITVHFRRISRRDVQNKNTHTHNHILKICVDKASTIFGLASSVIWVVCDHKHP
jgi:hypothetical protein